MNCFPLFRKSIQVSLSTIIILLLFLLSCCMMVSTLHAASVSLTWNANTESDLAGYKIYLRTLPSTDYGSAVFSGLPSNPSSPQKTISNLVEGRSYGAIVTAYDNAGNESGPSNEGQFTISSSTSATSLLTIRKSGSGSGTITSNPTGVNCGATCTATFPQGNPITVSAVANGNSVFTGWSGGGCSGTNSSCTVTLWNGGGKTVTATFESSQTATSVLTVRKSGSGNGTITSNPTGINCGATCTATFPQGNPITVSAVANGNSVFTGWSGGGCSGTNSSCTVTLWNGGGKTVTATFESSQTSGTPRIVTPTPGTSISGGSATFTWKPNGTAVTEWWLYVGTSKGAKDILTSGSIPSGTRSRTVSGLPTNGSPVWVKLWWRTASTDWQNTDFQYSTRR